MHDLLFRVVARYAARMLNVPPVRLDPCKHCGGEGVHVEKTAQVKHLCVQCWGTGTDPKSLESLRQEAEELSARYQRDYDAFQEEKKPYRGISVTPFGTQRGKDLQTLRIKATARQEQYAKEKARVAMGKNLAQVAGAAAR